MAELRRLIQTARADLGTLGASSFKDVTLTWPQPFPDTNYTVSAEVQENLSATTSGALVRQVRTRTTTQVTVRIGNGTQTFSPGDATVHVMGIRD